MWVGLNKEQRETVTHNVMVEWFKDYVVYFNC